MSERRSAVAGIPAHDRLVHDALVNSSGRVPNRSDIERQWATIIKGTATRQEIHAWAKRTLREVHTLASAYGWSEREILSMSAVRRALYLEMVQS